MPVKYLALSILIHTGIFATAIYFHAAETKDEKPKPTPIFFEVVEESTKAEEEKPKPKEKTVKEETNPEPKPAVEKKPVVEEKPTVEQPITDKTAVEKPITEEKKIVEKETSPKPVKVTEEIKKPEPPKVREKTKEAEPVAEKKIIPPEKPKASVERAKVISAPTAKGRITPVYPRSARRKGHEGEVVLEIEVSANGDIIDSSVVSSSGHEELDKAALAAVRKARFNPAQEDGINIKGKLRLPINFKLK